MVAVAVVAVAAIAVAAVAGFHLLTRTASTAKPTSPAACSAGHPCTYQVEVGQDLCLDQAIAYTPNRVELWVCWNGKNQRWIANHRGAQFTLSTQETRWLCVVALATGQELTMGPCDGQGSWWTSSQNRDDESYTLHSAADRDLCLGAAGGDAHNRTPVILQPCNGQAEVRWV